MQLDNIGKDKTDSSKYTFTDDQQIAIGNIIDFIAAPFDPAKYIVGLTGAGGTGGANVSGGPFGGHGGGGGTGAAAFGGHGGGGAVGALGSGGPFGGPLILRKVLC